MPHVHLFTDWIWACCYGDKPAYIRTAYLNLRPKKTVKSEKRRAKPSVSIEARILCAAICSSRTMLSNIFTTTNITYVTTN